MGEKIKATGESKLNNSPFITENTVKSIYRYNVSYFHRDKKVVNQFATLEMRRNI